MKVSVGLQARGGQTGSRRFNVLSRGLLLGLSLASGGLTSAAPSSIDSWGVDSGPIDSAAYFGETVANGMIGILSSTVPFRSQQTVIYGTYEPLWPGSVSSVARTFNFLDLDLSIDGIRIDRLDNVQNFHQTIDFRAAAFTTSFDYQDKARVTYTIRALRQLPRTALLDIAVMARRPIDISVTGRVDIPSVAGAITWREHPPFAWLNDVKRYISETSVDGSRSRTIHLAAASAKGASGVSTIAAAQSFLFEEPARSSPLVATLRDELSFTRRVLPAADFHFALVGATVTSADVSDPLNEAERLTVAAAVQDTQQLIANHAAAWAELWKSDIQVEGDDGFQRDLHSMLYHLYSFVREGSASSIPPMGLSGASNDYLGHIFWDAETWMFPALLALRPELARSIIDYRYERLPAARRNAALNGYRGAQFPWESAASGDEDTWIEAISGPLEIHVTADVALAAWNYYRVTQDRSWLSERGYPLLKETADFWASRVSRTGPGHYDIDHVVAADEYAVDVDNDAFTNAAARANLAAATAAAKLLGLTPDPEWEDLRRNIPVPEFPDGTTREHASYRGEKTKQADANLLAYPLEAIVDQKAIRRDLEFYIARIDDAKGPAMTKSIFAILYQKLGMPDQAYRLFKGGYEPNRRPPFGVLAESAASQNPYFATGASGLLQAMIYGFGGMEITDSGIVQKSKPLPRAWESLTLTGIGAGKATYTVGK